MRMRVESSSREATAEGPQKLGLLSRIQFPEQASWVEGTPGANAFKETVCDVLGAFDNGRLRARCSVMRDDNNVLRFMCKIEDAGDSNSQPATLPWSWWSSLVERPQELAIELRKALRQHRERSVTPARPDNRARARADKARGPAHGTWSTEIRDLGRGDQAESFCRNRRSRWPSQPSPRGLRPRAPR
jgi:hypothetical protein